MAYIKERGNNNYLVRVSHGFKDNGKPFQKSRLFRPSRINLPESKLRKELDAFVKVLEEECFVEFEKKYGRNTEAVCGDVFESNPVREVELATQSRKVLIQESSTPLFADFCAVYAESKRKTLSPTTYVLYDTSIKRMLVPQFGKMHLDEIKPYHVQAFINFLATPEARIDHKGKKLAPATIRRYLTIMQSIMTMALKQEYITSNPADSRRLDLAKIISPEVQAFDNDEVAEILEAAKLEPIHIHAVIATAI